MSDKQKETIDESSGSSNTKWIDSSSLIIILTLALSTIFYLWKIIFSGGMLPSHPSDLIEVSTLHRLNSILIYHQFPLWNEMWITGFPEYASPISELYDPLLTIPYLLLGLFDGIKLIVVMHLFLSGICFWLFSSTITSNKVFQLYGSILFMLSGSMIARFAPGHTEWMTTQMFIPLTMFFIVKSVNTKDIKYIIPAILSMSMFIFGGAAYFFAFFMILFIVYSVFNVLSIEGGNKKSISFNKNNFKILAAILILTVMLNSIKLLPILNLSDSIVRNDPIEPFKGSILFRDMVTFFVNGNHASGFSDYESYAYLGFLPVIFAFLSIFNKSKDKLYLYASALLFLFWGGGSNTFLGWVHLLPFLNNFRVPGRALIMVSFIIISLSLYGLVWFVERYQKDPKSVSPVLYCIGIVILFESQEMILTVIKSLSTGPRLEAVGVVLIVSLVALYLMKDYSWDKNCKRIILVVVLFSVFAVSLSNIHFISPQENDFNDPTIQKLMGEIKEYDNGKHDQIWITTNGWPYYQTYITYSAMINDIHIMRGYYAYYLTDMPFDVVINNNQYYAANYLVDTNYIDSGEKFELNATFEVDGIGVYEIENSLPNAFAVSNGEVVPVEITYFSPNRVEVDSSNVNAGDIIVYKNAYYGGWKVNGMDAQNVGNMVGYQIQYPTDTIIFSFSPTDFKIGALLSAISMLICLVLFIKRKSFNKFFLGESAKK